MLQLKHISCAAFLDAEEAFVGVGFCVAAADRFELLRADFGASLECERGQTAFHRHNEHVFAAVLFPHMAFAAIQFVVGAADERWRLLITIGVAMSGRSTILQRHGHHTRAARLLLQLALCAINVAIRTADGAVFIVFGRALVGALEHRRLECGARSNMGQTNAASIVNERKKMQ